MSPGPASTVLRFLRGGCDGCLCGRLCEPCRDAGDSGYSEGTVLRVTPERVVLTDGRVFRRPPGGAPRPGQAVVIDPRPGIVWHGQGHVPKAQRPADDTPFVPTRLTLADLPELESDLRVQTRSYGETFLDWLAQTGLSRPWTGTPVLFGWGGPRGTAVTPPDLMKRLQEKLGITEPLRLLVAASAPWTPGAELLWWGTPVGQAPYPEGVEVLAATSTWEAVTDSTVTGEIITTQARVEQVYAQFLARNRTAGGTPGDAVIGTVTLAGTPRPVREYESGALYRLRLAGEHPARDDDVLLVGEQGYRVDGVGLRTVDVDVPRETPLRVRPGDVLPVRRRGEDLAGNAQAAVTLLTWDGRNVPISSSTRLLRWRPWPVRRFPLWTSAAETPRAEGWWGQLPTDADPDWPHPSLRRAALRGGPGEALRVGFPGLRPGHGYAPHTVVLTYRARRADVPVTLRPSWYAPDQFRPGTLPATGRHWGQARFELDLPPDDQAAVPWTLTLTAGAPVEVSSIVSESATARPE